MTDYAEELKNIVIGRPTNGISINGLEYLCDNNKAILKFSTFEEAKTFLLKNGYSEQNIKDEGIIIKEINPTKAKEKSFSEQVDDSLSGKIPFYCALKVCDTPSILLAVGCEQLPMLFTQRHLRDAIKPKRDNNIHLHGLTIEQVKALPQLIANPIIIYDSLSKDDSIVAVTSELDGDRLPIIISVLPNGKGRYEMQTLNSNFITSVHGRNNIAYQIDKAIKLDKILFCDKVKSQALFERWGLPLPELTNALDSTNIIHQSRNIVNSFNENSQKNIVKRDDIM